jgi:hypothetical protein
MSYGICKKLARMQARTLVLLLLCISIQGEAGFPSSYLQINRRDSRASVAARRIREIEAASTSVSLDSQGKALLRKEGPPAVQKASSIDTPIEASRTQLGSQLDTTPEKKASVDVDLEEDSRQETRLAPAEKKSSAQEASSCSSCKCSYVGQGGGTANCDTEIDSKSLVEKWIPHNATVLEVGARYGSVSCAISSKLKESGRQVSIEANHIFWNALDTNRRTHKCNFHSMSGMLGSKNGQRLLMHDLGTFSAATGEVITDTGAVLRHYSLEQIQHKFGFTFDVATLDCRGCAPFVFRDFPVLKSQLRVIILEQHAQEEAGLLEDLLSSGWSMADKQGRLVVLVNKGLKEKHFVMSSKKSLQWKVDLYECPTASMGSSCEQVCANRVLTCSEDGFKMLFIEDEVRQAFASAGVKCNTMHEYNIASMWDGPWLSNGVCGFNSHPSGTTHCRGSAACGYNRVCPCI